MDVEESCFEKNADNEVSDVGTSQSPFSILFQLKELLHTVLSSVKSIKISDINRVISLLSIFSVFCVFVDTAVMTVLDSPLLKASNLSVLIAIGK